MICSCSILWRGEKFEYDYYAQYGISHIINCYNLLFAADAHAATSNADAGSSDFAFGQGKVP